jgi:hypothetical protein
VEAFKFHSCCDNLRQIAMTRARRNSTKQILCEVNHILPPTYFSTINFSINLSSTPTSSNWSKTRRAQILQKSRSHLKNATRHCKRKFSRHGDLEPEILFIPVPDRNNECTVVSLICELHTSPISLPLNLINLIMSKDENCL